MKQASKRFDSSIWTRYVFPVILAFLLLALIATILIVLLAVTGVI
jgi:hypothetical protein